MASPYKFSILGIRLVKIVILAAGKGSRLGGKNLPKPLTCLTDGKSILQHQIDSIERYLPRKDIILVVGYHKEILMEAFDDLLYVYSPRFAVENTSKSLLRAIKKINEDMIWINGDVLFHPLILEKLIANQKDQMVVTVGRVGEEEVKFTSDANGKITAVSKTVLKGQGEAIGINLITAKNLPLFQKHLEACQDNDYFEKALEYCIKDGLDIWTCPTDSSLCTEIDFPEDLERANAMLKTWVSL